MPMQSQHFSSPPIRSGRHFGTVAMHLQLYTLISYIFAVQSLHNRWFQAYTSLQQGTCVLYCGHRLQANGSVRAKSGGRWSRSAGSRSPQRLFCTKSSVHGISVIKGRWSLTTEIVKSSFNCIYKFYLMNSQWLL